jgi:hypothetical protein
LTERYGLRDDRRIKGEVNLIGYLPAFYAFRRHSSPRD